MVLHRHCCHDPHRFYASGGRTVHARLQGPEYRDLPDLFHYRVDPGNVEPAGTAEKRQGPDRRPVVVAVYFSRPGLFSGAAGFQTLAGFFHRGPDHRGGPGNSRLGNGDDGHCPGQCAPEPVYLRALQLHVDSDHSLCAEPLFAIRRYGDRTARPADAHRADDQGPHPDPDRADPAAEIEGDDRALR